jgi:hypothetical protein
MKYKTKKIMFELPKGWENSWHHLEKLFGLKGQKLLQRLIKDEIHTMKTKRHIEAYEDVEAAMRDIEQATGTDGMVEFAKQVRLIAKKVVETGEL